MRSVLRNAFPLVVAAALLSLPALTLASAIDVAPPLDPAPPFTLPDGGGKPIGVPPSPMTDPPEGGAPFPTPPDTPVAWGRPDGLPSVADVVAARSAPFSTPPDTPVQWGRPDDAPPPDVGDLHDLITVEMEHPRTDEIFFRLEVTPGSGEAPTRDGPHAPLGAPPEDGPQLLDLDPYAEPDQLSFAASSSGGGGLSLRAVPEPSTSLLVLVGTVGIALLRRTRA